MALTIVLLAVLSLCLCGAAADTHTNSWAVEVLDGADAANRLALKYGFVNLGEVVKDIYHFQLPEHLYGGRSLGNALYRVTDAIKLEGNVGLVEQQVKRLRVKKSYTPPSDPNWNLQWSLLNVGQLAGSDSGNDLNVEPAWLQGITGCGSVVAIVDDGVEYTHPDLESNYVRTLQADFLAGDGDPFPPTTDGVRDEHGTNCAGEIAMAKDNDNCGVGVAYNSFITGIRLLGEVGATDIEEASALGHESSVIQVYSNSWGPGDNGFTVEGPGNVLQRMLQTGATEGRDGKGSIYVFASGNGGEASDSCAADGYAGSIYTIAIGSGSSNGSQAAYDENCSAKMAVTLVNDPYLDIRHVTTSTVFGECTGGFDGTSAACPLASGAIALALESNPELSWRDVQYLLAYTSNPGIVAGGTWQRNGGGLLVSPEFGFGAIDAEALVTRARHWTTVPQQQTDTVPLTTSEGTATMQSAWMVTLPYSGSIAFLEHVVFTLTLQFADISYDYYNAIYNMVYENYNNGYSDQFAGPSRGDIQVEVTSPSGTTSIVLPYRRQDLAPGSYNQWPFMSVHFWGEDPTGDWNLVVRYAKENGTVEATINSVTFYGTTETPETVQRIPSQCDVACRRGCAALGSQFCDACANLRNADTRECIESCPAGYTERNGYCYDASLPEPSCDAETPTSSHAIAAAAFSWFALTLCAVFSQLV